MLFCDCQSFIKDTTTTTTTITILLLSGLPENRRSPQIAADQA